MYRMMVQTSRKISVDSIINQLPLWEKKAGDQVEEGATTINASSSSWQTVRNLCTQI